MTVSSTQPRKEPRALTAGERRDLLRQLQADQKARRHDLPDLVFFMLATGVRIGEALAVMWAEVDWSSGTVRITSTLIRVKGEGLLRKGTKRRAGERTLPLPESAIAALRRRFMSGAWLDQPIFADVLGGFRDPANVRRELRDARGDEALAWTPLTRSGRPLRRSSTRLHSRPDWWPTSSVTPGR